MNDENFDSVNADLARLGHEREAPTSNGREPKSLGIDQIETGLAGTGEKQTVQKEDERLADGFDDALDAESVSTTRAIVHSIESIEYSGPLPIAAEMNSYDDETRELIRSMHKLQIESAARRQEQLVKCVIESDKRLSDREDRLADAEIEQAASAQKRTVWINMALIISAVIVACLGHEPVAIALISALAVVNVATLFMPLRGRKKKDETDK